MFKFKRREKYALTIERIIELYGIENGNIRITQDNPKSLYGTELYDGPSKNIPDDLLRKEAYICYSSDENKSGHNVLAVVGENKSCVRKRSILIELETEEQAKRLSDQLTELKYRWARKIPLSTRPLFEKGCFYLVSPDRTVSYLNSDGKFLF